MLVGEGAYAALQTTMLSYEEPQLNRDSDFRSFACLLFPRVTFKEFISFNVLNFSVALEKKC